MDEQRGCKGVHWEKRVSVVEMNRIGSAMVESSVLFPVASVSSLEENGTSVVFSCSGDNFLLRQLMPPASPSSGISHLQLRKRYGTCWLHTVRRVTVHDKSFVNMLIGTSFTHVAPTQEGEVASTNVAEQFPDFADVGKTPTQREISMKPHIYHWFPVVNYVYTEKPPITSTGDDKIQENLDWMLV